MDGEETFPVHETGEVVVVRVRAVIDGSVHVRRVDVLPGSDREELGEHVSVDQPVGVEQGDEVAANRRAQSGVGGIQLERLRPLIGVAVRIRQDLAEDRPAGRVAGQPDMQEGVAIEDVVAAAADDGVAAGTAQDDVAAVERYQAGVEEARQAGDEVDVVELILGHQLARRVVAQDPVVERRTAGTLGVLPDVTDVVHRAVGGDELLAVHVLVDTLRRQFIGAPVEAETAHELGEAAVAQHDVVAAEALHDVAAGHAADHHVVAAVQRLLAGRRAEVAEDDVALAAAALEPVVALLADQRVEAFAADLDVVAQAAEDAVVAAAAFDVVVAVATEDVVDVVAAEDGVVALVAVDGVEALAAEDRVVAGAAEQEVVAEPAVEHVVAAVAPHRVVVRGTGRQLVVSFGATEDHGVAEEVVVADEPQRPVRVYGDLQLAGDGVVQPGRGVERTVGIEESWVVGWLAVGI